MACLAVIVGMVVSLTADTCISMASQKRGVCMSSHPGDFLCEDFGTMPDDTWWYDWGSSPLFLKRTKCRNIPAQPYAAMVWSKWGIENVASKIPPSTQVVLGFNEPNHVEQANLSPAEAASLWHYVEEAAGPNRTIVGPAAAPCGGSAQKCLNDTIPWFDEFFRLCADCRIDYLATHHYSCNPDWTMGFLNKLWNRYGKKIWLTEFACPQQSDEAVIMKYMRKMLPRLERAPHVAKYAWYLSRQRQGNYVTKEVSLFDRDSSSLSALGEFYFNFK